MQEAGVLLGVDNQALFWHTPNDRSGGALPDSCDLWNKLWENRATVTGFAHTHPGSGTPGPSYTDITTFEAIEKALGKHLNWFILSSDSQVVCLYENEHKPYGGRLITVELNVNDMESQITRECMNKLRELSNY